MVITVNPETERKIAEQIKLGRFASPEEVVDAAVSDLSATDYDDSLDEEDIAAINEAQAEIDRGEGIDLATLKAEMAKMMGRA